MISFNCFIDLTDPLINPSFANDNIAVGKLNLSTINCWITIMSKIENSYLWLKQPNKIAKKNLLDFFEAKNIDSSRIVFAERVELYEEHLARYKFGDLLLDTFIYNGHTTTIESLWAGLPVITLEGNSFASRVSSSILKSIGFDSLFLFFVQLFHLFVVNLY